MAKKDLIKMLKQRNRHAIEFLYDRSYQVIENYAFKVLGNSNDVPDFFQDAIIILLEKIDSKELSYKKSLVAYFIGIARILILRQKTNNAKSMLTELVDVKLKYDDNLEYIIQSKAQYDLFYKYFSSLDQENKKILQLYFDKKSMKEIQEIMGYSSISYTKKKKHLSQKKLIERIKSDPTYRELSFDR